MLDHLSVNACNRLIDIYHSNKANAHEWPTENESQPMYPLDFKRVVQGADFLNDVVNDVVGQVRRYFNNSNIVVERGELVCRFKDCGTPWHFDTTSNKTALTSITYLNDNFEGGETCFKDGTRVKPLVGRTIIFDGNYCKHSVAPSSDTRFVMPIWYTQKQILWAPQHLGAK